MRGSFHDRPDREHSSDDLGGTDEARRYASPMDAPRYCYRHPNRETGLSCSDCGRPICVDCMTVAPVGIRCPEHAGGARPKITRQRVVRQARGTVAGKAAMVTRVLVGANVVVYLITVAQ